MQLFGANNLTTPPQSKHILVALMILTLKTNLGGVVLSVASFGS
jgi:hypothetical protein